ncbi:sigma-54-dependent Fis family transcriptional regulator [Alkalilimnicola ehrlichii]|uniref:sigma-54 interaction domain-containing protein n=1 Tax=Alkalilimnicola ehrlichii TaxID=351052 RepID=UPI0021617BBA|nr:sigma 54-interacting transcriptional regulator [Alkalilimnicola ehrlichii]
MLIVGESGTGKELLAQGIHNASPRRGHPFVAFNCGAFPAALLESELFGYEEGAFTGSRRGGKPGLFEAAHTGTVFLDEIGEMPVGLQTRLLRVLQEQEVIRLGATEPTPVNVRVIAATHRNLAAAVASGEFRQDLYYRLNILRIDVPPLRNCIDDVPAIARQALAKALPRLGGRCDPEVVLAQVLPLLRAYRWPGNVRELENLMERLAVYHAEFAAGAIGAEELRTVVPELFADAAGGERAAPALDERARIEQVLAACGGNRSEASRRLGISRSTLWRKLNAGE